jgi:hypothetical protein
MRVSRGKRSTTIVIPRQMFPSQPLGADGPIVNEDVGLTCYDFDIVVDRVAES